MYKPSEYAPGDRIRIFTYSNWGPGSFVTGTVEKVTPSGQLIADVKGDKRRFTARGREVGGGDYRAPWVEGKAEAEERCRQIVAASNANKLKVETRAELDRLRGLDPTHQQADLIAGLRALADKLAQTGA